MQPAGSTSGPFCRGCPATCIDGASRPTPLPLAALATACCAMRCSSRSSRAATCGQYAVRSSVAGAAGRATAVGSQACRAAHSLSARVGSSSGSSGSSSSGSSGGSSSSSSPHLPIGGLQLRRPQQLLPALRQLVQMHARGGAAVQRLDEAAGGGGGGTADIRKLHVFGMPARAGGSQQGVSPGLNRKCRLGIDQRGLVLPELEPGSRPAVGGGRARPMAAALAMREQRQGPQ